MTKENENGYDRKLVVERIRHDVQMREQHQLHQMTDDFPHLRRFLIGRTLDGDPFPQGRIGVGMSGQGTFATLSIPNLLIESRFEVGAWGELWNTIEIALGQESVAWSNDWKFRQREAGKWMGV